MAMPSKRDVIGEAMKRIRKQGPCAMCGNVPYAAHRLIDAQMGAVLNGMSLEDAADEYGDTTPDKMLASWAALVKLLYRDYYNAETRARKWRKLARNRTLPRDGDA